MSMLISDYDGTFANSERNISLNSEAISRYLSEGNTFVLSSGRSYTSLLNKVKEHNIPYSFLACADGSYLFDQEGNLLLSHRMSHDAVEQVDELKHLTDFGRVDYTYEREYSEEYNPEKPISSLSFVIDDININSKFVQKFLELKEQNPQYDYFAYGYNGTSYYMIKAKGISKSSPIEHLQKRLRIPKTEIYTVGDGLNDLEMIRDYNGFVIGDEKALQEVALAKYDSVYSLVDDIAKKKVKRR